MNTKVVGILITILIFTSNLPLVLGIQDNKNLTNSEKLLEIKNAINQYNAQWTAEFNTIFAPDRDIRQELLGCPIQNNIINTTLKKQTSVTLPSSFDWRDVEGINYVTSIKNQGNCGSCTAFGTIGAIEAVVQIEFNEILDCDLSEAHLFFCSGRSCGSSMSPSEAADFVKGIGVVDELCFPYTGRDRSCDEKASNSNDRLMKIKEVGKTQGEGIKEALIQYGPVLARFNVYEDFYSYTSGIYEHVWGTIVGGHAITIVGYNDDPGYWICKNSWSEQWGENGFFNIKYEECGIGGTSYYFNGIEGNVPPSKPKNIYPQHLSENVDIASTVTWDSCIDVNEDQIRYSLYLNEGNSVDLNSVCVATNLTSNYVTLSDLKKGTLYSLLILAEDEHGSQSISDEVTFTTRLPNPPIIEGPSDITIGKKYSYTVYPADLDGTLYYWFFKWGDGSESNWLGPYGPLDNVTVDHAWTKRDTYNIEVQYRQDDLLSQCSTLQVSMKKSYPYHSIFEKILKIYGIFSRIDQLI